MQKNYGTTVITKEGSAMTMLFETQDAALKMLNHWVRDHDAQHGYTFKIITRVG